MTTLMLTAIQVGLLIANLSVLAISIKVYTEILKVKTVERIAKVAHD